MRLFVDDIRQAPDATWMVARDVSSAINALTHFEFAVISLDHDISHQVVMGTMSRPFQCSENFKAVAHFIVAQYKITTRAPILVIHSSNPSGAKEMQGIFAEVGLTAPYKPHALGPANRLEMDV
jgi:hypothetical protein